MKDALAILFTGASLTLLAMAAWLFMHPGGPPEE